MNRSSIYFTEHQKFNQPWLWILIGGVTIFMVYIIFKQLVEGIPVGNNPAPDVVLVITLLLMGGILALFASLKLTTEIGQEGVAYRYSPIHRNIHVIPWSDIAAAEVVTYKPIGDYLGWGIRWGRPGKGRAYTVRGNKGLQLELINGKRILIGTQQAEELREALEKTVMV